MSTATTKMKTRRAGHRGVLTKLLKKVEPSSEELLQEYDVSELSTIRGLIVKKQETIDQLNEKIVEELSEDEVSEEIEEADRYTYDIEMAVTKISKIIKESEITAKQSRETGMFQLLRNHRVADCKSDKTCKNCNKRHHTSICSKNETHLHTKSKLIKDNSTSKPDTDAAVASMHAFIDIIGQIAGIIENRDSTYHV
ncbi:unnamed protein product [Mytilus coruscus]|uniref:Uncharacterized protein n=1 Tax=Mytilus coruscus TaxID=42192 RepID=A0A6J8D2Q4_MYTCO|nr:unnamed protein product [Mytilus coruscus]